MAQRRLKVTVITGIITRVKHSGGICRIDTAGRHCVDGWRGFCCDDVLLDVDPRRIQIQRVETPQWVPDEEAEFGPSRVRPEQTDNDETRYDEPQTEQQCDDSLFGDEETVGPQLVGHDVQYEDDGDCVYQIGGTGGVRQVAIEEKHRDPCQNVEQCPGDGERDGRRHASDVARDRVVPFAIALILRHVTHATEE